MRFCRRRAASLRTRPVVGYLKKGGNVGEEAMRLFATRLEVSTAFLLLAMSPLVASAQPTSGDQALDDRQLLGMRLFNQSCRVCHTKPQIVSPLYGPKDLRVRSRTAATPPA